MRNLALSLLWLFCSLAIYHQAPWLRVAERDPAPTQRFVPPLLEPGPQAPCSACLHDEAPERSTVGELTGMEWQCSDCGTVYLGTMALGVAP